MCALVGGRGGAGGGNKGYSAAYHLAPFGGIARGLRRVVRARRPAPLFGGVARVCRALCGAWGTHGERGHSPAHSHA